MKIIVKDNIVIAASEVAEIVSNGIQLDEAVLGIPASAPFQFFEELPQIIDVETLPSDFKPHKYLYSELSGFTINPEYKEYKSPEQEMSDLKDQVNALNIALAEMMGV